MTRLLSTAAMLALCTQAFGGTLNFRDVTGTNVVETTTETTNNEKHVDFGDFDLDGDLDVVVGVAYSDFGARRNKLYRNDAGVFLELSADPYVPGFAANRVTRSVFMRDYTGDGWPDIWVLNDQNSNESEFYINEHPGGIFDHFEDDGLVHFAGSVNNAETFDADGINGLDLLIANGPNSPQNKIWLNSGAGLVVDVTATQMPVGPLSSIDIAAGDLNGDGTIDLLISGHGSAPNQVYYNDLAGTDSSGPGDYLYVPSGVQFLGNGQANENSMEAGDFDGDGRNDIYWSDGIGGPVMDRILRNTGNDASGKAVFDELPIELLPASVTQRTSRKPVVADLNDDGRPEVLVMKEDATDSRPTVLRNTSLDGAISFVDWTPRAFPAGQVHKGWHSAIFDADGDGDPDIFLGGWTDDHLFENVPPVELDEADLPGGVLPMIVGGDAIAISGAGSPVGPDAYASAQNLAGFVSLVLTGAADYRLSVVDAAETVLAVIDRGGLGVEEAGQVDFAGPFTIVVEVLQCGDEQPADLNGDCVVDTIDFLALLAAWGPNPGHPADFDGSGDVDVVDFLELLGSWSPDAEPYLLEILARAENQPGP